jgi:GT2 family glycosyltransferase
MSGGHDASVEVLIVSYNTRELTLGTLRSLRAWAPSRPGLRIGVAVLDNASADRSADAVAAEFPEVRLVRSDENLGFGKANNLLAQGSDADYLLLLNSDTILVEDLVGPLLAELTRDPGNAITAPRLEFPDGRVQWSSQEFPRLRFEVARTLRGSRAERALRPIWKARAEIARVQQEPLQHERATRTTRSLWATCWLLRRAEAQHTGLFDDRFPIYDEDLDLCRRLAAAGRKLVYIPSVRLIHLGGMSSANLGAKLELEHAARRRYYRAHHGRLAALAFVALKRFAAIGLVRRVLRITAG